VYYTVDSRKRTYAETWRIHSPSVAQILVAALCKLLGVRLSHSFAIRRPDSLNVHPTPEVPLSVRRRLADHIARCEDVSLTLQFYATVDAVVGGRAKAYLAALLDTDRLSWATTMTVLTRGTAGERVQPAKLNCFSLLPDGRYLVTTDHRWKLTPHPGDVVDFLPREAPEAIVAAHRRRVRGSDTQPVTVREEALERIILAREQRHVDWQIERGVYVPMTGEELERVLRKE
jgi:hypothetical protein